MSKYNDPLYIDWHRNAQGQEYSVKITNETKKITNNIVFLTQIPDIQYRVQIEGMFETEGEITDTTLFKVNYENGMITFHESLNEATKVIKEYYGRGVIMYPASRIYTKLTESGDIEETLEDITNSLNEALTLSNQIQSAENLRIENENIRVSNENTRKSAEITRGSNESTRISNENNRTSAESIRVANEDVRQNNETIRVSSELQRIIDEDIREENEIERIDNEDIRLSNEQTRISNEDTRQSQEGDRQASSNALKVWEDYDNLKDYIPLNKVQYQGSSYVNIVACRGITPTNISNWQLIAAKGQDGVGGDMYKSLYDTNNNGKVDIAENAEKLEGKTLAEIYADIPEGTTVVDSTINGNIVVNGEEIQVYDDTEIQNNIDDLAGVGRTTETVKNNADKIGISLGLRISVGNTQPTDTVFWLDTSED